MMINKKIHLYQVIEKVNQQREVKNTKQQDCWETIHQSKLTRKRSILKNRLRT
jgi:hypothetical protein